MDIRDALHSIRIHCQQIQVHIVLDVHERTVPLSDDISDDIYRGRHISGNISNSL